LNRRWVFLDRLTLEVENYGLTKEKCHFVTIEFVKISIDPALFA